MFRTRRPLVAALISLTFLTLAGCTGGAASQQGTAEKEPEAAAVKDEPGSGASVATASLAEQTIDATTSGDNPPGGTLTITLRAVEVTGETMAVRWAVRWDNPDKEDGLTASSHTLDLQNVPIVTDGTNLKVYKPFCTEGSWTGGVLERQSCGFTVLASPGHDGFDLTNHATQEAWAILPAPQGKPGPLEVVPFDGGPTFSGVVPVVVDAGK